MRGPGGGEIVQRGVVLEQARLQVGPERAQLALGRTTGPTPPPVPGGEAVPGVGEADEVRTTPVAVSREHWADPVPGGHRRRR